VSIGFGLMELVLLLAVGGGWTAFTAWSWGHLRARTLWRGDVLRWRYGVVGWGLSFTLGMPALLWALGSRLDPSRMLSAQALLTFGGLAFVTLPAALWGGYLFARTALPPGGPRLPGGGEGETPGGERTAR
jgi:hypothetical protein